jgi:hypothetical protein
MGVVDTNGSDSVFTEQVCDPSVKPLRDTTILSISTTPDISRPERYSISADYFDNHCNSLLMEHKTHSDGGNSSSPEPSIDQISSLRGAGSRTSVSPDRGRSRRVTRIPFSDQHPMYLDMGTPVTYGRVQAPWLPPMLPALIPAMPSLPPPPPPHAPGSLGLYSLLNMHPTLPDVSEQVCSAALTRRLSVPPSTILRPFLKRGPLPLSPAKTGADPGTSETYMQHVEQSRDRRRTEAGGILKAAMASAVRRRITDSNVQKHQ